MADDQMKAADVIKTALSELIRIAQEAELPMLDFLLGNARIECDQILERRRAPIQ